MPEAPVVPKPKCFVIVPMATSISGYDDGHFKRVLDELIKPACEQAGFAPYAAETSTAGGELIMADVLRQLLAADMVVCDMSARNPNVFYELGLRKAG